MTMQYLTSKTSLLTFVIILALLLFYLWFKYNIGLSSLIQQRAAWESRYDELLQDFEGYTAKMSAKKSNLDWHSVKTQKMLKRPYDWDSFKRTALPTPDKKDMHEKWLVVTTISAATDDIKKLAEVKGWQLLVVGDKKTPAGWHADNTIYLDIEKQKSLGYNLVELMPYGNYARKSIGHLYAIQHGAKYIYETDDDNHPSDGKLHFHEKFKESYYVFNSNRSVVNAYEFLGQSTIWPRGYPLDMIAEPPEYKVMKCDKAKPLVQQGVVDGDPDIDAIYRLTRKDKGVRLDVKFDREQDVVLLPKGSLCPYNAQNTLYVYDAFWSLLLPATVNMRITDIWRSYVMQRLLWEIGGHLSFFPPSAYQYRSAHNYLKDFKDEKLLYYDSGRMVDFLLKWKPRFDDLFDNIVDLSIQFAHTGFWGPADIHITEAWLQDLIRVGYKRPKLNPLKGPCEKPVTGSFIEKKPKEQPSSYLRAGKKLVKVF